MKKLFLAAAALCAAGFTANTFAQAQNFEGFALSAATGYQTSKGSADSFSTSTITQEFSDLSGAPLWLAGEYTWSLNDKYTMAVGLEYNALSSSESNWNLKNNGVTFVSGTYKTTSISNLYIKPGMALDKDALIYAKFGMTSTASSSTGSSGTTTDTGSGYSIGFGYRQSFSKTMFLFGEVNSLMGNSKDSTLTGTSTTYKLKGNATNALVGIGFPF
jgi:hypothetical protein